MRGKWRSVQALAVGLLSLTGCITDHGDKVKRPEHVEEFTIPPDGDTRYCKPPEYPSQAMKKDDFRRDSDPQGLAPPGNNGRSPQFKGAATGGY